MFRRLKFAISNPKSAVTMLLCKCPVFRILPDSLYLSILYRLSMEKKINLKNPQTLVKELNKICSED